MERGFLHRWKELFTRFVRSAILYACNIWCQKESEMVILRRIKRSMVRTMCGMQLKDRKRAKVLMLMFGLIKSINKLAMENSVHWYGHVLRMEDGHVSGMALKFECQKKKRSRRGHGRSRLRQEVCRLA